MHITVQNVYDIQNLIIRLSVYMNAPTKPSFLDIIYGMEYFMHQLHEPIIYSIKKNFKKKRSHINVSSKQVVHKSTKIRNTTSYSTYIVIQITLEIFLTGSLSPQHLTSSMLPSLTGAPRNNLRHIE